MQMIRCFALNDRLLAVSCVDHIDPLLAPPYASDNSRKHFPTESGDTTTTKTDPKRTAF